MSDNAMAAQFIAAIKMTAPIMMIRLIAGPLSLQVDDRMSKESKEQHVLDNHDGNHADTVDDQHPTLP